MKLSAPTTAPALMLTDAGGQPVALQPGKRMLLAFFRDTRCPFCNLRIFELTQRHRELSAAGLEITAIFASTPDEVAHFVRQRPRPFHVVADPDDLAFRAYGIQHSFTGKLHAVFFRTRQWLAGMRIAGWRRTLRGLGGLNTGNVLPADFLIDESGCIRDVYYGEDAGDHIPFERIERFLARPAPRRQ
ncbi:hypothetical protein ABB34_09505 [Stenotrophomonas daejeonensis]|uniref:Thioredoxin domain-containing protein n=1 Tax=Stenotrophomonas daejeonensis TaxID=659018 RepID=A0A0R0DQJ3_9GAMM|nr:redoxin domain-containing protein [Stenotrophomonas daejeonensis]KRG84349.1 hypothetical protein ABB34_09505 [Stenotrophomonas daejeonensis]